MNIELHDKCFTKLFTKITKYPEYSNFTWKTAIEEVQNGAFNGTQPEVQADQDLV